MLQIEKWGQDKPILLAFLSFALIRPALTSASALQFIKDGGLHNKQINLPPLSTWLDLYRDHRKVQNYLFTEFPSDDETSLDEFSFMATSSTVDIGQKFMEYWTDPERELVGLYKDMISGIKEEISKTSPNDSTEMQKFFSTPIGIFLMKVWFPCQYLYNTTPMQFIRKARLGDLDAMENLIRIDSSVIFDKRIAEQIHQLSTQNRNEFERITNAINRPLKAKTTVQKLKCSFAGHIFYAGSVLGLELQEPDIRELFDAFAQDYGRGLIDTDIPETPHGFYQAIQKEAQAIKHANESLKI